MSRTEITELQVVVQQEPGTIHWNYDQLKVALAAKLHGYEGMVYTDDSIQSAKADVAMLRKLRKAVEDQRKKIRETCLQPYTVIEAQAKELTGLIDKPIEIIDRQVKDFEERRRTAKKQTILDFMAQAFADLPDRIQRALQLKVYDRRWENATAKEKDWQQAVDDAHMQTLRDIAILNDVEEEFRDSAIAMYTQNLVLSDALSKVTELRHQKEIILENERRRHETEERRPAEQAATKMTVTAPETIPTDPIPAAKTNVQKEEKAPEPAQTSSAPKVSSDTNQDAFAALFQPPQTTEKVGGRVIRIHATEDQYRKIFGYIKYVGATYEEVQE